MNSRKDAEVKARTSKLIFFDDLNGPDCGLRVRAKINSHSEA